MFSVRELVEASEGRLISGRESAKVIGVSIDSRTVRDDEVYIAIIGKNFDGHTFVGEAVKQGAKVVIVSRLPEAPVNVPVIQVTDTTLALAKIARFHRARFKIPVIAITGSAGKTTTKEMIAAVLKARIKVLKNPKTENNVYGVSLAVLKLNASHKAFVTELGTNQPGDIDQLAEIVSPTIAVFTNIGASHLAKLKNLEGVFNEKFQLVKHLQRGGQIIYNADDPYLSKIAKKDALHKKVTYALKAKANFQASVTDANIHSIQFKVGEKYFRLKTPALHNVSNALAAIACGHLLKITDNNMNIKLGRFAFKDQRYEMRSCGSLTVIDDTYNSNPVSFQSAIQTLDSLPGPGQKILVCADMLELGESSRALHEGMGALIAKTTIDFVITMGDQAKNIADKVQSIKKEISTCHCQDIENVNKQLKKICRPGDVLLVKGSRGMQMERAVAFLDQDFK